jgi:polysaccharide biosynthesis/export protein
LRYLLLLTACFTGCALAPGMKMDESAAVQRGKAKNPTYRVEQITPPLVSRLAEAATRPRLLEPDPLHALSRRYQYTVAPYDVLQVTVWDHPELTAPSGQYRSPEENGNPVAADGTIFYPHVGTLQVEGKTVREIRELLSVRIAVVVSSPQIDVRVAAFRGKRVQVNGEVVAPITIPITDVPLRVQDALAAARGFGPEADLSRVRLIRNGRVHLLDLQSLYERGDTSQDWLLTAEDVVNVPDRSRNKVFVIGEVRAPQSRVMKNGRMTLAEALTDPGGLGGTVVQGFEPSASNVAAIYVIRGDYDAPSIYHLDASSADAILLAAQFPLEPRDVVFVSTYGIARFNRVMQQILPTVQTLWQTYDIVDRALRY